MAAHVRKLIYHGSQRSLLPLPFQLQFYRQKYIYSIKYGSSLPSVEVFVDSPSNPINVRDIFKDKKGVLFSVLGAFTPGCSQSHIPEYLENYDKFKAEGYEVIACVAVNDPYVMSAWGKDLQTEGKIMMLADTNAELTKAMRMELDCRHIMGTIRSKRYSVVIHDNVVKGFNGEPDHSGLACLMCIKNINKKQAIKERERELQKHTPS